MKRKDKKPVEKWQLIIRWICAVLWTVIVIVDFSIGQKPDLTILHCIAAVCFLASAIITTLQYRRDPYD